MHKILIAHSLYPPHVIGGAEISTQILAQTLNPSYDVKVMTVGGHKEGEVLTDTVNGIEILRLPFHNRYWIGDSAQQVSTPDKVLWRVQDIFNFRQYRHIKRYLSETMPSVIHTQNIPGLSLAIWKAAYELDIPVVHTLRDFSLIEPIKISAYSRMYRKISRRYSRMISAVIGISGHILITHTNMGLFENSSKHVIHNIVEKNAAVQDLYASKEVHHNKPLDIGYFGQLTEVKGVQYLIDAVIRMDEKIAGRLFIFGDGPMLDQLKRMTGSDPRIIFRGKVEKSQVAQKMKDMDLNIVPSTWDEPFGRVVIESYQVGTPIYASRVGGMPEILLDARQFSFAPHSVDEIVKAILHYYNLSEQDKRHLKHQCFTHCQSFNEDYLLKEHSDIYEKIITRRG
ncbi:glycosyltransferase [Paenibacillus xylanilyticus]|uniref:Glycosyltransferase n=1 Tax=Paenibacillus xylanilyticus TaxID=248903 RepID=A0A7Y6C148_9BACL|nr:glycosyltransferase [Paenibacillus xylanilyticus]NUU78576.1 glycosyltransferase [Paenibacillus xylanilyticus]